jgi:hypothetical protein
MYYTWMLIRWIYVFLAALRDATIGHSKKLNEFLPLACNKGSRRFGGDVMKVQFRGQIWRRLYQNKHTLNVSIYLETLSIERLNLSRHAFNSSLLYLRPCIRRRFLVTTLQPPRDVIMRP